MRDAVLWIAFLAAGAAASAQEVDHPTKLELPPLEFVPPSAAEHRIELSNGLAAYLAPDPAAPGVSIQALLRAGTLHDPDDAVGLSRWLARFLESASTPAFSSTAIEELLDRSASLLQVRAEDASFRIEIELPSAEAQAAVQIVCGLLRAPRFDAAELDRERELAARNPAGAPPPEAVLRGWFRSLLYRDHPLVRSPAAGLLSRLSQADLEEHHRRFFRPSNVVLAVAGAFDREVMLSWLESELGSWTGDAPAFPSPVAAPEESPRRIVVVDQPGLRKTFGYLGHFGVRLEEPDYFAVQVMNWILTGSNVYLGYGVFNARLWFELRTNRGISSLGFGEFHDTFHFPPPFVAYWNGREERAGEALAIVIREIDRIRREPVSRLELDTAKRFFLYGLPSKFHSAEATARALARLEHDGAPADFYQRYQREIAVLTEEDLLRAARKHIRPEKLLIVLLGDAEKIQRASRAAGFSLESNGPVEVIQP